MAAAAEQRVSQIWTGFLGNATGWEDREFSTESLRGQVPSRGAKAYIMSIGPQRTRPSAQSERIRKSVWRVLKMGGQELWAPERHRVSSTIREYGKASEDTSRSSDDRANSNSDLTRSSTCRGTKLRGGQGGTHVPHRSSAKSGPA